MGLNERASEALIIADVLDHGEKLLAWAEAVITAADEAKQDATNETECWQDFSVLIHRLPEYTNPQELVSESEMLLARTQATEALTDDAAHAVLDDLAYQVAGIDNDVPAPVAV